MMLRIVEGNAWITDTDRGPAHGIPHAVGMCLKDMKV